MLDILISWHNVNSHTYYKYTSFYSKFSTTTLKMLDLSVFFLNFVEI
jgi:hypothetical protein